MWTRGHIVRLKLIACLYDVWSQIECVNLGLSVANLIPSAATSDSYEREIVACIYRIGQLGYVRCRQKYETLGEHSGVDKLGRCKLGLGKLGRDF